MKSFELNVIIFPNNQIRNAACLISFSICHYFSFFLMINVNMISLHIDPAGLIEEYDSPKKLLKNKSSSLTQLVAEYTKRSNSGFGN